MPDDTDDWMDPPRESQSYIQRSNPDRFLIQRERRVTVFGPSGSITQWDFWMSYPTAEERDRALARLREDHPRWHLRPYDRKTWEI